MRANKSADLLKKQEDGAQAAKVKEQKEKSDFENKKKLEIENKKKAE